MKINISSYRVLVIVFYILAAVGLYKMILENDFLWLIPLWIMIRINHFFLSLHHRLISHKSFEAKSDLIKNIIIFSSVFQANHSPLRFAIAHRHHHKTSDTESDVHGPVTGFLNTIFLWEFNLEKSYKRLKMNMPKDLIKDKFLLFYDKYYYIFLISTFAIIYLINENLFWYVFIPAAVLWKIEANLFVNWYCHIFGYKNTDNEKDHAHNSLWAGYLTMGEGWHNNHHANPANWNFKRKWWEFDATGWIIERYLIKK